MKISLFKNSNATKHSTTLSLSQIVKNIRTGIWREEVETIRKSQNERRQKALKKMLPAFTLCGECTDSRDVVKPSGYIGIDIDAQDNEENVLEKFSLLCRDPFVHACWPSSRGSGLWVVFKINSKKHEESFLGIEKYMYEKYSLTVDINCKDKNRICFASYYENAYMGHNKKVFRKLVKAPKIPVSSSSTVITYSEVRNIIEGIVETKKDITGGYHSWRNIGFICAELGEQGRKLFQDVSKFSLKYGEKSTDVQFNKCLNSIQRKGDTPKSKKVSAGTLVYLMNQAGVKIKLNGRTKLHLSPIDTTKTIYAKDMRDEGRDVYTYELLEFRVIKKKFKCTGMHSQRVGEWLQKNGYKVFGTTYYHIENNIVKEISIKKVQNDVYVRGTVEKVKGLQFMFDDNDDPIPKDLALDAAGKNCKKILDNISFNTDFDPNDKTKFLRDTETITHLKYRDTVVCLTKNSRKEISYASLNAYVWEKSIRPYNSKTSKEKGAIEKIFDKAIGEKNRNAYRTAVGYMISGFIPPGGTPILFCCDLHLTEGLNNGGNGKDFMRQVLEQVRKVDRVPGQPLDLKKEFAMAWGDIDTEILWIEDLNRNIRMQQFYNYTDGIPIRRLQTQPFFINAKMGVSLQHTIDMESPSDKRRQFFLLFENYFSKLPKGIASEFNYVLHTDWPKEEREKFNFFIEQCCQQYLRDGLIAMPLDALIEARKQELHDDWFSKLEPNKVYRTVEVRDYLTRQGMELGNVTDEILITKWAKWCALNDMELVKENPKGYPQRKMIFKTNLTFHKGGKKAK